MRYKIIDFEVITTPISSVEEVLFYLNSKKYRTDFILNYPFFGVDSHTKVYESLILRYLNIGFNNKLSNQHISDLLQMAIYIGFFDTQISIFCVEVLKNRFYEYSKLSSLEYLFFYTKKNKSNYMFEKIFLGVYLYGTHDSLKVQALFNLTLFEFGKYSDQIFEYLETCKYPTYFYRLANFSSYFDNEEQRIILSRTTQILLRKPFDDRLKKEILDRMIGEVGAVFK